jgi:hypothetical protein
LEQCSLNLQCIVRGKNINYRCLKIKCSGKYSVPVKVELYRQFRILHNAKLDWIYRSGSTVRIVESRVIQWIRYVARWRRQMCREF